MSTSFPERLAVRRKQLDMTQADLARASKVNPQSIAAFETGRHKPNYFDLKALCIALKISADELLGLKEREYEKHTFRKAVKE